MQQEFELIGFVASVTSTIEMHVISSCDLVIVTFWFCFYLVKMRLDWNDWHCDWSVAVWDRSVPDCHFRNFCCHFVVVVVDSTANKKRMDHLVVFWNLDTDLEE